MIIQTFFLDYLTELRRVVNNIRERHSKVLGTEDWQLFRQTLRILEICGELISAYEQFETALAQQLLPMLHEWQNKTQKLEKTARSGRRRCLSVLYRIGTSSITICSIQQSNLSSSPIQRRTNTTLFRFSTH